ncbi:hypothetical protein FA95DRAFT_920236 [Auriscalpium vulgare]|uniref:Uncharacterized protein n=1 Tax=Auriscalpium vulgare TaxID=40419 RepID=A0ACB8RZY8_9AGAM|nr:hypothetical protein FA95DRAFT_920236 [Auriscalpium vulgare]
MRPSITLPRSLTWPPREGALFFLFFFLFYSFLHPPTRLFPPHFESFVRIPSPSLAQPTPTPTRNVSLHSPRLSALRLPRASGRLPPPPPLPRSPPLPKRAWHRLPWLHERDPKLGRRHPPHSGPTASRSRPDVSQSPPRRRGPLTTLLQARRMGISQDCPQTSPFSPS